MDKDSNEKQAASNGQETLVFSNIESDDSVVNRPWVMPADCESCENHKLIFPSSFPPEIARNLQTFALDEKFFLQFDYKTRNKLKTKQRRLDPMYRNQERIRQRTVMRLKRQDPQFRAVEREKGRYRMRLKRLDPVFRSQERERQRERMKLKRSDPDFREREREQQKSRLHIKKLNLQSDENEKSEGQLQVNYKQNDNEEFCVDGEKNNIFIKHKLENEVAACIECNNNTCNYQNHIKIISKTRDISVMPRQLDIKTFAHTVRNHSAFIEQFNNSRIFNFHFYNSGKETRTADNEICSQSMAHYGFVTEDFHIYKNYSAEDKNTDNASLKDSYKNSKNSFSDSTEKHNVDSITVKNEEKKNCSMLNSDSSIKPVNNFTESQVFVSDKCSS